MLTRIPKLTSTEVTAEQFKQLQTKNKDLEIIGAEQDAIILIVTQSQQHLSTAFHMLPMVTDYRKCRQTLYPVQEIISKPHPLYILQLCLIVQKTNNKTYISDTPGQKTSVCC